MGSLKLSVTNLLVHGWDIFPHGKLSVTYLHKQTYSHGKLSVNIPLKIIEILQLYRHLPIRFSLWHTYFKYIFQWEAFFEILTLYKDIIPMEVFSDLPTMWVHFSHGKPFIYVAIRQRKNLFPMGSFLWQIITLLGHISLWEAFCDTLACTYVHRRDVL